MEIVWPPPPEGRKGGKEGKVPLFPFAKTSSSLSLRWGTFAQIRFLSPVVREMYYLGPCPEDVEPPSGRCIYLGPASQWKMHLPAPAPGGLGQIPVPLMLLSIFRTSALDVSMRLGVLRRFGQLFALAVGLCESASGLSPAGRCAPAPSPRPEVRAAEVNWGKRASLPSGYGLPVRQRRKGAGELVISDLPLLLSRTLVRRNFVAGSKF